MKESTHKLMTLDFWRVCIANCLFCTAVWSIIPILPTQCFLMGMNQDEMTVSLLLFVLAMLGVGPLHAFLGDVFRRKNVLMLSTLATSIFFGCWIFINEVWQVMLLMFMSGASFAIATAAGITISVDITQSNRRGAGNRMYAFSGALGLLMGVCCLSSIYLTANFKTLIIISLILFILSMIVEAGIYVAFRAPVGVGTFNLDRFFLPMAWMPALNVCMLMFGIGMLLNLLPPYSWLGVVMIVGFTMIVAPLTKMFIKLSHHCQRCTANTTLQLAIQVGFILGLVEGERIDSNLQFGVITILISLIMFGTVTWPYIQRKRVRG
ncbi:MAG: MFS transporter [Bacteroidaceae bacterium]|nr:MFS transporter [Bacteroidaceae bacterium]